jgi:O-acetyl-ADP-ribose deacetylase (regulator of RNase III)
MGSGIAGALAANFPEIPRVDRAFKPAGDTSKLGDYSVVTVTSMFKENSDGDLTFPKLEHQFKCVNLYTQYRPGPDFIESIFIDGLKKLNRDFKGQHLWFPKIGCGIGGGEWERVEMLMLSYLEDCEVTVVVL